MAGAGGLHRGYSRKTRIFQRFPYTPCGLPGGNPPGSGCNQARDARWTGNGCGGAQGRGQVMCSFARLPEIQGVQGLAGGRPPVERLSGSPAAHENPCGRDSGPEDGVHVFGNGIHGFLTKGGHVCGIIQNEDYGLAGAFAGPDGSGQNPGKQEDGQNLHPEGARCAQPVPGITLMGLRNQRFQQEERGRGLGFCFVLEEMDGGDEGDGQKRPERGRVGEVGDHGLGGRVKGAGAVQESSTAPCRNASPDRASVSVPLQGTRARTVWRRRQAEIQSSKWAA